MALTRCLPILLLVAMTASAGASEDRANSFVAKCYPPPTPMSDGGSAFRENLLDLLKALPSAAAPTGFASLQTGGVAVADRALVRGLCFGDSVPKRCRRCLSNASKKITRKCSDASRHAGFWDRRCFLGYADGANSSAGLDDDFGTVLFSGDAIPSPDIVSVQRLVALAQSLALAAKGSVATTDATTPSSKGDATAENRTVHVMGQCARDRSAADCVGCLREASLLMAKTWEADGGAHGRVAAVVGSNCYLRFQISTPRPPLGERIRRILKDNLVLTVCVAVTIV
ncbi:cysteine-rich repeat secretory protein 55-like, partial [Lolium rigidum]|uniref:cysteine-rich repeat secretory protein 55-like n=1 Tax=Lolium rigidum TaxID=89674 RepID=UPI001F5D322C